MITITASTLGISGSQFLWGYCLVSGGAAIAIADGWRRALGPRDDGQSPPEMAIYDLAILTGGAQLAIKSAAAELHRDGLLDAGTESRTLTVAGELDPAADPLEHAVFETVSAQPGIATGQLREQLAESEVVRSMTTELTDAGLLIDEALRSRLLLRLWIVGGMIVALGAVWILAALGEGTIEGSPIVLVIALAGAILWLTWRAPRATTRGRAELARWRSAHDSLRRQAHPGQAGLGTALFGGAALWLAAPEIAVAFGVAREAMASDGGGWLDGLLDGIFDGDGGGWFGGDGDGGGGGGCGGGGGGCGGGG